MRINAKQKKELEKLAQFHQALGHPARLLMMEHMFRMEQRDIGPKDLNDVIGGSLGVTSYHMRMLTSYGAVKQTRTAPARGALAHFYTLTPAFRNFMDLIHAHETISELPTAA
jgi:hypothetical protein